MLNFASSLMTIRVTFPREGKALSILPILKELLWQFFLLYELRYKILEERSTIYSICP